MKNRFFLVIFSILFSVYAHPQMSLVKDLAKKVATGNPQAMAEALQSIEPAFNNPESANNVLTWYVAGKAAFGLYDEMCKARLYYQTIDDDLFYETLSTAYDFYWTALPLDTIVELNKDGSYKIDKFGRQKVKTKYSMEIINKLTSYLGDIANAGNYFLQNENWEYAANAFGYYADIASSYNSYSISKNILREVRFYQAYSQYQAKIYAKAYENFTKARNLGYSENNIIDFQTSSLANMVQSLIDTNSFTSANEIVDNALRNDPKNGVLFDIKGFTTELQHGVDAALPYYRKAVNVDPNNANANFDVGRCLYLQAQRIIDENPNANADKIFSMVKPIYDEAIIYLQNASRLNPDETKAASILQDIYIKLGLEYDSSFANYSSKNNTITFGDSNSIPMYKRDGVYYVLSLIHI